MTDEEMITPDEPVEEQVEQTEGAEGPPPEMRAEDVLRFSIGLFADLAWINMGIRANPATGDVKTDFAQARLAIDAIKALTALTENRLPAHEVRELNNLVSGLQMNFVQKYKPEA